MENQDIPQLKQWLGELLHTNVLLVTFTKVDGTIRDMRCTLKPTMLPSKPVSESTTEKKTRKVNDEVLVVYDLDSLGWRSFKIESVTGVYFSLDKNDDLSSKKHRKAEVENEKGT